MNYIALLIVSITNLMISDQLSAIWPLHRLPQAVEFSDDVMSSNIKTAYFPSRQENDFASFLGGVTQLIPN